MMYQTTDGAVVHRIRLHDPDTIEMDTSEGFRTIPAFGARLIGGIGVVLVEDLGLGYEWVEPRRW
jgi:hypothetical protein